MIEHQLSPLVSERFLKDEPYRAGHLRIINALPKRRIQGVHVPEMKKLAKVLARKGDVFIHLAEFKKAYDADPFSLTYEETVVWGLIINALKLPWEDKKPLLKEYIPVLDNWGVCDTFCCNAKWKVHKTALWAFLEPYWASKREFEVRFAIVMSMTRLLDEEYFPLICQKIDSLDLSTIHSDYEKPVKGVHVDPNKGICIGESPYYVRMGVAWLLATALAKMPEQTRDYIHKSALPEDVIKLYKRKARESLITRHVSPL